jgi:hypothetical protein
MSTFIIQFVDTMIGNSDADTDSDTARRAAEMERAISSEGAIFFPSRHYF